MAKSATPDVFDKSDEIKKIKSRTKSSGTQLKKVTDNDIGYRTDRGTMRRRTSVKDKAINMRLSPELHRRLHDAAYDEEVSMNYMAVQAITEYLDRNGY